MSVETARLLWFTARYLTGSRCVPSGRWFGVGSDRVSRDFFQLGADGEHMDNCLIITHRDWGRHPPSARGRGWYARVLSYSTEFEGKALSGILK
jgi:hypothetical protein